MPAKRILLMNADGLRCFSCERCAPREEICLGVGEVAGERFASYLRQNAHCLFLLLLDVADEEFVVASIPPLRGKERNAVIARRMQQLFADKPYHVASSLGHSRQGRGDESLLFTALGHSTELAACLAALQQANARLVGIYTTAFLTAQMRPRQGTEKAEFISTISDAGLRQTFFLEGKLQISRLTPLAPASSDDELLQGITQNAQKLHAYLVSRRLIERTLRITNSIFLQRTQIERLASHKRDTPLVQHILCDIASLGPNLNRQPPSAVSRAEEAYVLALIRQTPKEQFATAAERHAYRLWKTKRGLHLSAVATLLIGLLTSAFLLVQAWNMQNEIDTQAMRTHSLQNKLTTLQQSLPPSPVAADRLFYMTSAWNTLRRDAALPEAALAELSLALADLPHFELTRLAWRLGPLAAASSAGEKPALIRIELEAQVPDRLLPDGTGQQAMLQALIDKLKQHSRYEVRIEAQSTKANANGIATQQPRQAAHFRLGYSLSERKPR